MATTFRIVRGVKRNRVREAFVSRIDRQPQRAKFKRNTTPTSDAQWTSICISIPVDDLIAIDDAATAARESRSHYMTRAAIERAKAGK